MLWSTLAILSVVTISVLSIRQASAGFWQRATSLQIILTLWGMNAMAGALVFATVPVDNRAVWRPLLAISAFVFVGLVAAVLVLSTRFRDDDEPVAFGKPGTIVATAAGVVFGVLGLLAVGTVWL